MLEQSEYFDNKINESKIEELRNLILIDVFWNGKTGWSMSSLAGNRVYNGSPQSFCKFLRQLQAKDVSNPRSQRNITYMEIVDNIMTGKEHGFYVWSNIYNRFPKMIYNEVIPESYTFEFKKGD